MGIFDGCIFPYKVSFAHHYAKYPQMKLAAHSTTIAAPFVYLRKRRELLIYI